MYAERISDGSTGDEPELGGEDLDESAPIYTHRPLRHPYRSSQVKTMNFVPQMMMFVSIMMICVLMIMGFVFKMMDSVF